MAAGALALIEHVLSQPKTSAVSVVMALSVQTLAIAWGRARRDEGLPLGRLGGGVFHTAQRDRRISDAAVGRGGGDVDGGG